MNLFEPFYCSPLFLFCHYPIKEYKNLTTLHVNGNSVKVNYILCSSINQLLELSKVIFDRFVENRTNIYETKNKHILKIYFILCLITNLVS